MTEPDRSTSPATARAPPRRGPAYYGLVGGFVVAAAVTAVSVALTTTAPGARSLATASQTLVLVLGLNLVLILGLAAAVGWRLIRLFSPGGGDAGAKLHRRFVGLFAVAAVAPALVVAIFFGVLVTRGVEEWFSQRVRTVVENSATVARSYVEEQKSYIGNHMALMAQRVNSAAPAIGQSPVAFGHFLASEAADNGFSAAYVLDRDGRVLARAEDGQTGFLTPPPSSFQAADEGVIMMRPFESGLRPPPPLRAPRACGGGGAYNWQVAARPPAPARPKGHSAAPAPAGAALCWRRW